MLPRTSEEIAQALEILGLTESERRAYQFLQASGPSAPSVISRETAQSRGRIYETLRSLVGKGLVREEPTRPIRYVALPLAEVLSLALTEAEHRTQYLRRARAAVAAQGGPAAPLAGPAELTHPRDISLVSSRRAVGEELARLAAAARETLVVGGSGGWAERTEGNTQLMVELREARRRGVRLEFYHPAPDASSAALGRLVSEFGAEAFHFTPAERPFPIDFAASETAGMVIVVQPNDEAPLQGMDVAIVARSAPLRDTVLRLARWGQAPPASSPAAIGASVVVPAASSQAAEIGALYFRRLAEARSEILGMGGRGWSRFQSSNWDQMVKVYQEAKARGVRFRALTEDAPEEREQMRPFQAIWDIRAARRIPVWMSIVDGKDLFQMYVGDGTQPPRMRHSTEPDDIRFYTDWFERMWRQAMPLPADVATENA